MDSTELVAAVQSYLNTQIAAPVQVTGSDERSVPSILIEGWSVSNLGSLRYVKSEYDSNDYEQARIYHIPYDCELNFLIRGEEAFGASQLRSQLRNELMELERHPKRVSDHIGRVMTGGGGGISYQYANPTEADLRQTGTFTAASVYRDTDVQPITNIQIDVEVVQ
jgi:hypothetical protein